MTKDQYLEMCEMLGNEPDPDEIPIEFDDLILDVQEAVKIYNSLQDCWDYMNGNYIGKNLNGFKDVLDIFDVCREDYRQMYELVMQIDRIRAKSINDSIKLNKPKKPA